jgi:hypothetical protein
VEENEERKDVLEKKEPKEEVRQKPETELERLIRLQTEQLGKS